VIMSTSRSTTGLTMWAVSGEIRRGRVQGKRVLSRKNRLGDVLARFATRSTASVLTLRGFCRRVDVPIHLYSLYSHPNPDFSQKWASRDEVLAYWVREELVMWGEMRNPLTRLGVYAHSQKRIAAQHRLHDKFVFRSEFVSSHWDNSAQQHTVEFRNTQSKETFEVVADVLISATGALNLPKIPNVTGRETFKGLQWHSSQWRDDVDLRGKKVAVVGNGSSGIQIIPNIVEIEGLELINLSVLSILLSPPSVPVLILILCAVSARPVSSDRRRTSITAASPNPCSAMSPSRSASIAGRRSKSSELFSP
jgi:hypothetical protein